MALPLAQHARMVYNIDLIRLFGDDIRAKLKAFDSIAVAVSGGRDSVALLHFLAHGGFAASSPSCT